VGFLKGTVSFTRYIVEGESPKDYRKTYPDKISRWAFRELDETSPDERSLGWVNIFNFLDRKIIGQEYFLDNYIALTLRIDSRKVPAKALKNFCLKAEAEEKALQNKQFLSKLRKKEIRERVSLQLLKRVIPVSSTCDMIWDTEAGAVWFASTSDKVCAEFSELFKKTFGLNLSALFPYTLAQKNLSLDLFREVDILQPTDFV
jgi:DNA recombination-dependent growth factor C